MIDYAEAETVLDGWDYHALPDGEEVIAAIDKAMEALRLCQAKDGETIFVLTRQDVVGCAEQMGIPAEAITDDVLHQVKKGVESRNQRLRV